MKTHETYLGIKPFGVLIDESPELTNLVGQARELKELPLEEKLENVKRLALNSMVNAYEQSKKNPDETKREFYQNVVFTEHPLSYALQNQAGCCRYQGALFFVLGYESDLGDKHFIQQAPVDPNELEYGRLRSVFNDIVADGKIRHISIFKESLEDKSLDYSKTNPRVFESAIGFPWPTSNPCPRLDNWKNTHYSYHRTPSGLIIASEDSKHVMKLEVGK
ncbi:MAG: hypothetical protein U9Q06_04505 [Nanoarchaeota archaeon]|nr:hypothetical protein [Nanoarchaeota archaeon]